MCWKFWHCDWAPTLYSVVNTLLPTTTAPFIKLAFSKKQTLKIQPSFSMHSGFLVRLYTVSSQFCIFSTNCHLKKNNQKLGSKVFFVEVQGKPCDFIQFHHNFLYFQCIAILKQLKAWIQGIFLVEVQRKPCDRLRSFGPP